MLVRVPLVLRTPVPAPGQPLYTITDTSVHTGRCSRWGGYEGTVELTFGFEPFPQAPEVVFENLTTDDERSAWFGVAESVIDAAERFLLARAAEGLSLTHLRLLLMDWQLISGSLKAPWYPAALQALELWRAESDLIPVPMSTAGQP